MESSFLKLILCPASRQALNNAPMDVVDAINQSIELGELNNVGGVTVASRVDGALIRSDGQIAYPIRDGIPHLLIDEGLPIDDTIAARIA